MARTRNREVRVPQGHRSASPCDQLDRPWQPARSDDRPFCTRPCSMSAWPASSTSRTSPSWPASRSAHSGATGPAGRLGCQRPMGRTSRRGTPGRGGGRRRPTSGCLGAREVATGARDTPGMQDRSLKSPVLVRFGSPVRRRSQVGRSDILLKRRRLVRLSTEESSRQFGQA